ncbi:MAG: glycosyltransferase [Bacteriovoracaceae bacterium]|nr:glycosyltransferase [Bacteriovoracaceae bacterium]
MSTTKQVRKENFKGREKAVYICPSVMWGARERTVLRDALISKSNGLDPYIYCLKDSSLDVAARENNINVIHHYGKIQTRFFKWYKLFGLGKIVRADNIAYVHCYHLNFIWPLSFFLGSRPEIPLFFTTHKEITKKYTEFYHKTLTSRVDQFFVSSKGLISNLLVHLDIPMRKIKVLGLGKKDQEIQKSEIAKVKKDISFDKDIKIIGSYISSHHKNPDSVVPLIYATMGYNQKFQDEQKVRLVLISDKNWNQVFVYQELIRFIKDLGSENDVIFYSGVGLSAFQKSLDVWVSAETIENLEDHAVDALLQGVPMLAPRTSSSKDLLETWGEVGLTYKGGDARDLRDQLSLILAKKKKYSRQITKIIEDMAIQNQMSTYQESLAETYRKFFTARQRVIRSRRSKEAPKGP